MIKIDKPAEGRPTGSLPGGDVLVGTDGNAFAVMGKVIKELRRAGATQSYVEAYQREATSGDYDHLITVSVAYLTEED